MARAEIGSAEAFSHEKRKPYFDLVQPRRMFGRVMKNDLVTGVAQKLFPADQGFQDAPFPLFAKVFFNMAMASDKPHNAF